ncbi:MAG: hypothetical protein KBT04_00460 [Bacteroidales bacterium]|nr:hypothetical protein [Candidatus Colimorpha onthohippi]
MNISFISGEGTCACCPRHCVADRIRVKGFCASGLDPEVASVCRHLGEEPPLCGEKGICNLFYAHCNLQCVYCQNYKISRAAVDASMIFYHSLREVVQRVESVLADSEPVLGLVSPTHYAATIPSLIEALHSDGVCPTVVYNSNGYDSVEMLRMLEPYIDVYLPDFKYSDSSLAAEWSHAADYPLKAQLAISEMCRQKGSGLLCDDRGMAFRGVIVRHLVLPGQVHNSMGVLDWMADNLPMNIHISLMAQYFPPQGVELPAPLRRTVSPEEYAQVVNHYHQLGFYNGWVQELSASETYRPDFREQQAFEV